jgi:hypothetical protein
LSQLQLVPTITDEGTKLTVKYRDKIKTHTNEVASTLLKEEENLEDRKVSNQQI